MITSAKKAMIGEFMRLAAYGSALEGPASGPLNSSFPNRAAASDGESLRHQNSVDRRLRPAIATFSYWGPVAAIDGYSVKVLKMRPTAGTTA